jgi:hypothetical protein
LSAKRSFATAQFTEMPWTVYGFFKLSTYFGHEKTVSYNHSKGIKAIPHSGAAGNTPFENRYFMGTFFSEVLLECRP